eukprot:2266780-Alexandrium_andersonii.AAC.1
MTPPRQRQPRPGLHLQQRELGRPTQGHPTEPGQAPKDACPGGTEGKSRGRAAWALAPLPWAHRQRSPGYRRQ